MKKLLFLVMALAAASSARAEDVSGKWKFTGEARGREVELTLDLKQKEEVLTGTVSAPRGRSFPISAKVEGEEISFTIDGEGNLDGAKVEGRLDDDGLDLTFDLRRGDLKGVATRSNSVAHAISTHRGDARTDEP